MDIVVVDSPKEQPYWLIALVLGCAAFVALAITDGRYGLIFETLLQGLWITVTVAVVGYLLAASLGLMLALMTRSSKVWLNQPARLYIEVMRGLPAIVILLYVSFVGAPAAVAFYQWACEPLIAQGLLPELEIRDVSNTTRGIIALSLAYTAFLAEVFRAGLQSVSRSQIEAAQVIGLNRWLTFRLVVWPQALRRVFPVLGNDFIAMVKDSSLVSVLGVADITQLGKLYASSSFLTVETYNVVAVLYLMLTIGLSLLLRQLEKRLNRNGGV